MLLTDMNSPSKRPREEEEEEEAFEDEELLREEEKQSPLVTKKSHLSVQEASKLLALPTDAQEIGTAGTGNINWFADSVFKNEYLFRKICALGNFPPIVHMSLKRAFPRQHKKAYPSMDIFQWVWDDLKALIVQSVPWSTDVRGTPDSVAEAFYQGFSPDFKQSMPHVSGGVLLQILQGEHHKPEMHLSGNVIARDLDIFCRILKGSKHAAIRDWWRNFCGTVDESGSRFMDPRVMCDVDDAWPSVEYDQMNSGCLFSHHKLEFCGYRPSHEGFSSVCLSMLSPSISVPFYMRKFFDLDFCKNYLTGERLVVMKPESLLHRKHACHDFTRYINLHGVSTVLSRTMHENIHRFACRLLKYAERGYTVFLKPSRREYIASVVYQLMIAMDRPSPSERKVDPRFWLDKGMDAAEDNKLIKDITDQWVNFEKFVMFLNPKTAPLARIFLREASTGTTFQPLEDWIKPYAEWVEKLQVVDFSVLEPLLAKSLENKKKNNPKK